MHDKILTPISARQTRIEDLPVLIPLYLACFAEPPWLERLDADETEADFREFLKRGMTTIFVTATAGTHIVGAAIAFPVWEKPDIQCRVPNEDQKSLYMAELFVAPEYRTRGVGKLLTRVRLTVAEEMRFRRYTVRTSVAQPAIIGMYTQAFGARIVGTQDVVSRKFKNGVTYEAPDQRVIMTGPIPY